MPPRSVAKLLVFSDTWNAIVEELRSVDLLSMKELRNLVFQHLPIDDSIEVRHRLKTAGLGCPRGIPPCPHPPGNGHW